MLTRQIQPTPSVATAPDAVFHMTDWLEDLEELTTFFENPESLTSEQVQELLM